MTRANIDLYPVDLALEDIPAEFSIEESPADLSVGDHGGIWATLESVTLGGLTLTRDQVQLMVGCRDVLAIETDVSERLSRGEPYGARFDLAAE